MKSIKFYYEQDFYLLIECDDVTAGLDPFGNTFAYCYNGGNRVAEFYKFIFWMDVTK